MFIKTKTQGGFTIIELLVVISIIAIGSSIVLMSLTGQAAIRQVEAETREFVSLVHEAQGYALTGKKFGNNNDPCYYLIAWSSGSYNLTYYYKTGADCGSTGSAVIATYPLDNGVAFSSSGSFYFTPPHAVPSFSAGNKVGATLQKNGNSKTACIYYDGLVRDVDGTSCP